MIVHRGRNRICTSSLLGLCILLSAAAAFAGKKGEVIARVGDVEIERAAFEAELAEAKRDTTTSEAEARRDLLEALIDRQLLVHAAREAGAFEPDSLLERRLHNHESTFIFERMRETEIRSKIKPTEADMVDFYAKLAVAYDASHIVVATEEEANEVLARLDRGADFATLADSLSLDLRTAGNGGQLPQFGWGSTTVLFLKELDTMKPGEVRGPIRSERGYHVMRLNARVPQTDRIPMAEVRDRLAKLLRTHIEREVSAAYYKELERRYHFTPNWEAAAGLARRFKEALEEAARSNPGATPEDQADIAMRSIVMPDSLLTQPLATWDFGRFSVGEEWAEVSDMPGIVLPDRKNPHEVIEDAASEFRARAMIHQGRARGLDRDPEIRRRLELKKEEMIVTDFYRKHIIEKATFSEADERAYYAAHPDQFKLPLRLKLATIHYHEGPAAEEMEAWFRDPTKDPDSLLVAHKARGVVRTESREGEWVTETSHPALFERAQSLKTGEVARVIDEDGYWTVFVLLEREEAKKLSFEEARGTVQASLRNVRADEILAGVLAELKAKYPVWVDEDYLSRTSGGD